MQTVLYVSEMQVGDELEVRAAHDRFPAEALGRGIGVERVVVFIGSGYYALELTVADGDFQENFHRFLGEPEVKALLDALQPYVRNLPRTEQGTADMPLATAMLIWQSQPGVDQTAV